MRCSQVHGDADASSSLHDRFDAYLDELTPKLGHADRVPSFKAYRYGLMLPLPRKSIEPIAASVDPEHVQARHQALLTGVAQWVLPYLLPGTTPYWIIDDTSIRKKGRHSVGVSRQYCGEIGKQDNCQVAVSLSVATEKASLPVAWRLYLPTSWTDDPDRCRLKWSNWSGHPDKPHNGGNGGVHDQEDSTSVFR